MPCISLIDIVGMAAGGAIGMMVGRVFDMVVGKDTVDNKVYCGVVRDKVDRAGYMVDNWLPHLLPPPPSWILSSSWNLRHPSCKNKDLR